MLHLILIYDRIFASSHNFKTLNKKKFSRFNRCKLQIKLVLKISIQLSRQVIKKYDTCKLCKEAVEDPSYLVKSKRQWLELPQRQLTLQRGIQLVYIAIVGPEKTLQNRVESIFGLVSQAPRQLVARDELLALRYYIPFRVGQLASQLASQIVRERPDGGVKDKNHARGKGHFE